MMSSCERSIGELLKLPEDALTAVLSKLTVEDLLTVGRTCRYLQLLSNEDQLWMQLCKEWEREVELPEWRPRVQSAKALFRLLRYFSKVVGVWSARQLYPRGGILHITWVRDHGFPTILLVAPALMQLARSVGCLPHQTLLLSSVPVQGQGLLTAYRVQPKGANSRGAMLFPYTSFVRIFELVPQPDGTAKAFRVTDGLGPPSDLRTPGYFVWTSPAMDCFYFQIDNYSQEQNSPGLGDGSGSSSTERQASISDGNDFRTNARSQPENRSLVDSLQQRFLLPNRSHGAEQPGATDRAEQEIASHLGRRAIRYLMRLATTDDNSITCLRGMKGEYSKLILEEPGPGRELSGLWSGVYGPHGLEVAHVSYTDQEIVATKVLGDPNVPAGEVTFKVALDSETTSIPDTTRTLAGALMSGSAEGAPPPELVKMYRGFGRIADHNFRNPQWVNGRLIVDSNGNLSFLWEDADFLIQFQRFNLEELTSD